MINDRIFGYLLINKFKVFSFEVLESYLAIFAIEVFKSDLNIFLCKN